VSANSLYFGDNLEILRYEIESDSVDLIYLDPPFNSKANYNLLFRSPNGHEPHAQITAFEDTWHWGEQAEREFAELILQPNTDVSEMMQALRRFLGENDVMAYLTMMANRLLELHRVLKPTGSLYLHCDPTASHYLKIVLDGIFGKENFRNEIVWKRTSGRKSVNQLGRVHDIIFFFTKGGASTFHPPGVEQTKETVKGHDLIREGDRVYRLSDLTGAGQGPIRQFNGTEISPPTNRHWMYDQSGIDRLLAEGKIVFNRKGVPRLKKYLEDLPTIDLGDLWTDIEPINSAAQERLGYPTQKPLTLLERILRASSNEGDTVLDPFCGCGTAIHASQKLKRQWIGIDITHLAISLVEKRLRDAFPGIAFEVYGTPKDFESARDLAQRDKYQFQWWACSLVNAQPYQGKKKGADNGIDGVIYFKDDKNISKKIVVSVKAGEHVSVPMIRDLGHVVNRERASMGLFVTLTKPTAPMRQEAVKAGFYVNPMGVPVPKIQILTVEGLLAGTEQPDYFDLMQGGLMSRKPEREVDAVQLGFDSAAYLVPVQTTEDVSRKDARVARAAKPRKLTKKTA